MAASREEDGLLRGDDGRLRCFWQGGDREYARYHDEEWGRPVGDDRRLFEKLCLEGFQAGLSWLTILRKRDAFRRAFADFDMEKVAGFGARDVRRLLADATIVRHRGKIEAAIANAACAIRVREESGSFAAYIWQFAPAPVERPAVITRATLRELTQTDASRRLSRDLRSRGFRFVGPTTAYAFMQAMGLVNDHIEGCFAWREVERQQKRARAERRKR